VGNLSNKDLKINTVEAPERMDQITENEESLSALSTMNILSEEEKLDLIKQMKDL
jgi:hypothetical protein